MHIQPETALFDYPQNWAHCLGPAPFLPTSREEMDQLGWDQCDIIIVTGDAYVDHPSFGMAVIGRVLEAQGFRVGIISQPAWQDCEDFKKLGQPRLFFGVAAGNMDSMINRYTADRRLRHDDAYTPGNVGGKRPDRAVIVYSQRCKEAFKATPIVVGSIEASLRRIAHYDYWSDKVRRSILVDSKADILIFGNAERAIVELAHRANKGLILKEQHDIRGTAFMLSELPNDFQIIDSSTIDKPGKVENIVSPYEDIPACDYNPVDENPDNGVEQYTGQAVSAEQHETQTVVLLDTDKQQAIKLPSYETVKSTPVAYAHASRVLHKESNPHNARALVQQHKDRYVWLNPPPLPLSTEELDGVFELPYSRAPHPSYGDAKIPAWEMIRFSVNIMRGCFGGCSFCSITEHEGRIIQSRSEQSILEEVEKVRDKTDGFTGIISDLGGPTANMWRLACSDPEIESSCKSLSCVYPKICKNLNTDQTPLISLYRKARELPGVKKVLIASGLRYDLAIETPAYVEELVTHHVGGYLKIAPEHTESAPLSKMMKPGIGSYEKFSKMFERYSKKAGKKQYLIPYFIAGHPGTADEDMVNLALWLKQHGFKADQVQSFYPSPMAMATAMYYSGKNPLRSLRAGGETVDIARGLKRRRLHKAFLRYHDPDNWPLLRSALQKMGRADLIGNGKQQLIPRNQPRVQRNAYDQKSTNSRRGSTRQNRAQPGKTFTTKNTKLGSTPHTVSRGRKKPHKD